jgi:uncharacterized Rossmann fold enzyme
MQNMNVYIVGKGPSLDRISKEDFPNAAAAVMCINDAVQKIESLGIPNPIYAVQQDRHPRNDCVPKNGLLFVSCYSEYVVTDCALKAVYCPSMFGEIKVVPTVVMAIHLAKYFGAKRLTFLCFDSCLSGDLTYAKCEVIPNRGTPEALKTHKARIHRAAGKTPYKFQEVINK